MRRDLTRWCLDIVGNVLRGGTIAARSASSRRAILLLASAAWFFALWNVHVTTLHYVAEHMAATDARAMSEPHDDHDNDHDHSMPQTLLCRRPSDTSSASVSLVPPCVPSPSTHVAIDASCVVSGETVPARSSLHLSRSPVLRI